MAKEHSYVITLKNNKTENEALAFLMAADRRFINPSTASRKMLLEKLGLDKKFGRAFDLVMVKGWTNDSDLVEVADPSDITLIELKTTQKKLLKNPEGFFFGATANEFALAEALGDAFRFCFVSMHPESKGFVLLTPKELEQRIRTKRIQFQINL